jgi:hypothetical protein
VERATGTAERAVWMFSAAAALRETIGVPLPRCSRADHERHMAALRAASLDQALAAAWEAGRALSLDEAIAFALDETRVGG